MAGQVLGLGERDHVVGDLGQRVAGVVDDVHRLEERAHRQARGVAGAAAGGQHVVGAGAVVAERDRRVRSRRRSRRRCGPGRRHGGGVRGLDLEVLGGVGVDDREALLEVVDQHDAGLAARPARCGSARRAGSPRPACRARPRPRRRAAREAVTSTAAASGSCSAWLSRSAATYAGVGGVVGEDRDLGRAGLGVDADHALEQPLGGDGVDVAGAGDQVDRAARAGAVGEHRDRLGAADGVHLVDAEQRAGGQDRRVRQAAVLLLRRGRSARSSRRRRPGPGTTFITTLDTSGARPPGT